MENTVKELAVTPDIWLAKRQPELLKAIESLKQVRAFSVPDPTQDLNEIHKNLAGAREMQCYVLNMCTNVGAMELEIRRLISIAEIRSKNKIGVAFVEHADVVALGKSYDEKMLRLRVFVPEIQEIEEWASALRLVQDVKETLNLVYNDLGKSCYAISAQVSLLKIQILTGDIKLAVNNQGVRALFSDGTTEAIDRIVSGSNNSHEVTL